MLDYLIQAKTHVDALASTEVEIPDSELIDYVVYGLGHEYKELITSMKFHTTLSFDDLYDLLIKEDNIQKCLSPLATNSGVASTSDVAFTANSVDVLAAMVVDELIVGEDVDEVEDNDYHIIFREPTFLAVLPMLLATSSLRIPLLDLYFSPHRLP